MKNYTGWQWLLIDAANHRGLDKELFETRIAWGESSLRSLEEQAKDADNKPLYLKAVMAIRKAQRGLPTGHMVGVDACCSGIQIMSAMTGCIAGATATGLVDPNVRADAYSSVHKAMMVIVQGKVDITRKQAKDATMTSFYGSKLTPKAIFGADTPELSAFYQAAHQVAPGPWELLQDLLGAWRPYALTHSWKMPDGFDVRIKVMERKEARIEVDELDHASFTYEFYVNQGTKSGISLPANVTHSMDGYVAREMHRRCNYDRAMVEEAKTLLVKEMYLRSMKLDRELPDGGGKEFHYYVEQYNRSTLASAAILPHLTKENVILLSGKHLESLFCIVDQMLEHPSFPLVTVHDEFKAHANNIDQVRWHYKEILAEIADSNVLSDIMSQLLGEPVTYKKLSTNLGDLIRGSNYALT